MKFTPKDIPDVILIDGDTIEVDGTPVTGTLIGGPTNFSQNMDFYAYRVDITDMGIVVPGANSFEITGFDFVHEGGSSAHDENNGAGILAIYDDGTMADLQLFDGLDMAFFKFDGMGGGNVVSGASDESADDIDDVRRARTLEPKAAGDFVYLLGATRDELGGSEYYRWLGERDGLTPPPGDPQPYIGTRPPQCDPEAFLKASARAGVLHIDR